MSTLVDWSDFNKVPADKVTRHTKIIVLHGKTLRLYASGEHPKNSSDNCFGDISHNRLFRSEDGEDFLYFRLCENPENEVSREHNIRSFRMSVLPGPACGFCGAVKNPG